MSLRDSATEGTWKEVDVKSAVTGNGFVDFYIVTGSTDGVDYSSTEAREHPPTLVIRWSVQTTSGSPTAPTPTPGQTPAPTPTPVVTPGPPTPPSTPSTPGVCSTCLTYYVDSASGQRQQQRQERGTRLADPGQGRQRVPRPGRPRALQARWLLVRSAKPVQGGTAERPIIFGSYGSGALPVIQGARATA